MMTMAIAVILVGFAVPTYERITTNTNLDRTARELQSAIMLVRSEAIKRNANVQLKRNTDWNDGWVITTNAARTYDECLANATADCVRLFQPPMQGFTITTDVVAASLDYRRSGRPLNDLVFTICPDPVGDGYDERVIRIGTTGLPQITHEDEC